MRREATGGREVRNYGLSRNGLPDESGAVTIALGSAGQNPGNGIPFGERIALRIRGFVLGVMLLAAVGWCMVQESIKQTQARYELAELLRREQSAKQRLERLRTEEQELRSPGRLAALVREQRLKLVVLGSAEPVAPVMSMLRKPGEVMDDPGMDGIEGVELEPVEMASVSGYW